MDTKRTGTCINISITDYAKDFQFFFAYAHVTATCIYAINWTVLTAVDPSIYHRVLLHLWISFQLLHYYFYFNIDYVAVVLVSFLVRQPYCAIEGSRCFQFPAHNVFHAHNSWRLLHLIIKVMDFVTNNCNKAVLDSARIIAMRYTVHGNDSVHADD